MTKRVRLLTFYRDILNLDGGWMIMQGRMGMLRGMNED